LRAGIRTNSTAGGSNRFNRQLT